jgi:hypothetical protein
MLLFVIGNLFLFQPVVWDNSKIFFFSYLGICLLLSVWFFENFPRTPFRSFVFTLSFLVAFCGSGFLELIYTVTTIRPNQVTSTNEQEIGAKIAEITPPLSRFLTAPSHNHFVMAWSGRPIVAGFTPWLDNFGVDGAQVLTDINQMLKEPSKSQTLFEKYKPDYIVLSSAERGMNVDEDFYTTCCTTIFKSVPGIEIVDIKKLRQNVLQGK